MDTTVRIRKVLIVDDDAALRELIARHMRRKGLIAITAGDGEAALAHYEMGSPAFDVVITDVHMPRMSGIELTTRLLQHHPSQRIVIVTGDPDEALAREAISRGPVSYLLKPFELFELEAAVNQALDTTRAAPSVQGARRTSATVGALPAEWLLWVDEHSYAGVGHADRVAKVARLIASALPQPFDAISLAELDIAAWSHEIGLLAGPFPNPVDLVNRGSQILMDRGSSDAVAIGVRHMHERWDGTGGPDHLLGLQIPRISQVLAVADAIDHYCSAWIQTGIDPEIAAARALTLVGTQEGTCFNPEVTRVLKEQAGAIRNVCAVSRRGLEANNYSSPSLATVTVKQA